MQETWVWSLGWEDLLEGKAWQSIPVFLPGESPWTEKPVHGLLSMGLQRIRHDWVTKHNIPSTTLYWLNVVCHIIKKKKNELGESDNGRVEDSGNPLQYSCLANPSIPTRMEELCRLQSMGSLRVGHNWATSLSLFTFMHWRGKWQPTPVFLPGNPMDGAAWWAPVHGVTKSRTRLSDFTFTFTWSQGAGGGHNAQVSTL